MKNYIKILPQKIKQHPKIAVGFAVCSALIVTSLIYFLSKKKRTVKYAKKWVGTKEISGNMGFENAEFDELMRKYGDFKNTQAWCMSFVKMIWIKRMGSKFEAILDKLITPSTQTTYQNFVNDSSGLFSVDKIPRVGSIVIWQKFKNGQSTWQGHTGIVKKVKADGFITIEGNTNDSGGREGIEVAEKERGYNWNVTNGLRLKGFISKK